jgi:hypothetical protein
MVIRIFGTHGHVVLDVFRPLKRPGRMVLADPCCNQTRQRRLSLPAGALATTHPELCQVASQLPTISPRSDSPSNSPRALSLRGSRETERRRTRERERAINISSLEHGQASGRKREKQEGETLADGVLDGTQRPVCSQAQISQRRTSIRPSTAHAS